MHARSVLKDEAAVEAVTMEALKAAHENEVMVKAVVGVTLATFALRMVSFDAFLLLVLLLNGAAVYGVRHRHAFIKKFAKGSLKRRAANTKTVVNHWMKDTFGIELGKHKDKDAPPDVRSSLSKHVSLGGSLIMGRARNGSVDMLEPVVLGENPKSGRARRSSFSSLIVGVAGRSSLLRRGSHQVDSPLSQEN